MAYYNSGDRILTSDEFYDELIFKWKIGLFIVGSLLIGITMYASMPVEWPKVVRFILIAVTAIAGGKMLSHFAREIEMLSWWALRLGVVFFIGIVVWNLI